ncbi:hypothetical protein [Streptomyces sp. NPDC052107]|uniref:hypothetical protein n=1 Tax=Streptomyces sp. NPDC052107 TaxID=3155632 RepID=UPI00343953D8
MPEGFRPAKVVFAVSLKDGTDLTADTLFPFSQVTLVQTAENSFRRSFTGYIVVLLLISSLMIASLPETRGRALQEETPAEPDAGASGTVSAPDHVD